MITPPASVIDGVAPPDMVLPISFSTDGQSAFDTLVAQCQADAACRFEPQGDGFRLAFEQPQWAVTPGQSAVLYRGEVCLGGGVIARAE